MLEHPSSSRSVQANGADRAADWKLNPRFEEPCEPPDGSELGCAASIVTLVMGRLFTVLFGVAPVILKHDV